MAGYAPGTGAYEDEGTRRHNKALTRSTNLRDLFMGLGAIAQQMGAARRAREAEADQQVEADMLGKVYSEDAGGGPQPSATNPAYERMPQVLGGGEAVNNYVELPQERQAPGVREEILGARSGPASTFTNLANTFTLGARPGRLSPQAQMRLLETQRGLSRDRSEAGYRSRQEGRADRGLDIEQEKLGVQREAAGYDAANKQRDDDLDRLHQAAMMHINAGRAAPGLRKGADLARSGKLTVNDFINDELMQKAAESNPEIKAGIQRAGDAKLSVEERAKIYKSVGEMLDRAADAQESIWTATKAPAEAWLRGGAYPAAERIYPGSTSQPLVDAPTKPVFNEEEYAAEWKRKRGIDRPLTPEEADQVIAEIDKMNSGGAR